MRLARIGSLLLASSLVVTACGATSSSVPSATVTPSAAPAPTPVPSATPSPSLALAPSPSASAAVDPTAGLLIAPPYTLSELDPTTAATIQGALAKGMGAFASVVQVGTREIQKNGTTVAYVMVILFPAGSLTDTAYKAALGGIEASANTTFKVSKVAGYDVSTGTMSTLSAGVFHAGNAIALILAPVVTEVLPAATALITANK